MVRLPSSRGTGFLVRRRRSDEPAHLLDAAVAGLVEGEPGILVELLPPGGRSVLPVDLRFVGISPAAVPYRGAGIAFGGLCIAGAGGVAAYGIALGRAHSPNATWHQPHVFSSVLRYISRRWHCFRWTLHCWRWWCGSLRDRVGARS